MNGDHRLLYKSNFLDPALKVPMIVKPPDLSGQGAATRGAAEGDMPRNQLVELMDVGATLMDYAGGRPVGEAILLRACIEDADADHRAIALSEFLGHSAVVTTRWKTEFAPTGRLTLLIDRVNDPEEQANLAGTDAAEEIAEILRRELQALLERMPPPTTKAIL